MNREQFMNQLGGLLSSLSEEERREALDYYENYFEDAGPEREQDVIGELGSPEQVAKEILSGYGRDTDSGEMPVKEKHVKKSFFRRHPVWTAVLAVPVLLVGLPLVVVAATVLFVVLVSVLAVLFSLVAAAAAVVAALFVCGVLFLALACARLFLAPSVAVLMLGAALLSVGLGILSIYLVIGAGRLAAGVCGGIGRLFRKGESK